MTRPEPSPDSDPPNGLGAGSRLARARRLAGRVFFGGAEAGRDFVAGDVIYHQYPEPAVAAPVTGPSALDAATMALADPVDTGSAGYAELLKFSTHRPMTVLLSDDPDVSVPTAVRLLRDQNHDGMYRLTAAGLRSTPMGEQFHASCGYLLDQTGDDADDVRIAGLLRLVRAAIGPLRSRLVVAARPEGGLRQALAADCFELDARVTPGQLIGPALGNRPHQLDRLVEGMTGARAPADGVALRDLRRRAEGELDDWFAALPGWDDRGHALALAVLDGLPYDLVRRHGERLARAFAEAPAVTVLLDADVPRASRHHLRSARLERLRAEVFADYATTPDGEVRTESVRYRDAAYPSAVLRYAWSEYDDVPHVLLHWLLGLGGDPDEAVRIRAATAAGMLATLAFDHVRDVVVEPWAGDGDPRLRDAAACALHLPSLDPHLYARVRGTLDRWIESGTPALSAAAGRALGASVGHVDPGAALTRLDALAGTGQQTASLAVADSLAELVEWDPRSAVLVLRTIAEWVRVRDPSRNRTGQLAFLVLATDLTTEHRAGFSWPTLLALAESSAEVDALVVHLWQRVLNERFYDTDARTVLTVWASVAEAQPAIRPAFHRLVVSMARDHPRTRRILRTLATTWVSHRTPRTSPHVAAAVFAAMNEGALSHDR
ncbi:hypothetical protein [Actinoplanes sp. L3-i22]|uniref:hypothetical protein n=1 Tax=Actinoplanes sp. L3-i22 TaxID=2836373 RepID=UPI001C7468E2|nr:hypothetical protein [Actinoplanes sp. L3-i22]BCY10697.1 hypothetical protein L3i22_057850 [Actinoplanes sp. L3-i22]